MRKILLALALFLTVSVAYGIERFPRPDFESGYVRPTVEHPAVREEVWQAIDIAALVLALTLATWLAHKKRSRMGLFILAVLSLAYFGFIRTGCVCSVGSVQNIALALSGHGYTVPFLVLAFFLLPLLFALLFGRVFCSSVCPLGAIQELVLLKPIHLPYRIDRILRFGPWIFLGIAILYAATNSAFPICEHDPFVSFFRFSGTSTALMAGGVMVLISTVIGRAYCRYICPYGALLAIASRLSWKRITITPDKCIQCRLCENACPYGAIKTPVTARLGAHRARERKILALLLVLLPVFAAAGAWAGYRLSEHAAGKNPVVKRALIIHRAEAGEKLSKEEQDIADAFFLTHAPSRTLYKEADTVRLEFLRGTTILGGILGLLAGLGLIGLTVRREQPDYEADRATCFACGRCYAACPRVQAHDKETV